MAPGRTIPSYETIRKEMGIKFEQMKTNMKAEFATIDDFSITADCWTGAKRGYLGVTIHWIKPDLTRDSAFLACQRITGTHSYDVLAKHLYQILVEYEIQNKCRGCVTDGGSNFVKCFKQFGEIINFSENDEEFLSKQRY